jgi:MurNAc alpha-1-phosphate uridylyltransferase
MKAMILAAGRGERMRPITDHLPKPLIPIAGKPLIAYHLERLAGHGITDCIINVAYLSEQIQYALGNGERFGVKITYSIETTALETGGGIKQALPLLGKQPFMVINGDVWTDYPFASLLSKPLDSLAHLVLIDNPKHNLQGDFGLSQGYLRYDSQPFYTFSGIGLYQPRLFVDFPEASFRAMAVLKPAIQKQQVTGEHYAGAWFDVGSPERLTLLQQYLS